MTNLLDFEEESNEKHTEVSVWLDDLSRSTSERRTRGAVLRLPVATSSVVSRSWHRALQRRLPGPFGPVLMSARILSQPMPAPPSDQPSNVGAATVGCRRPIVLSVKQRPSTLANSWGDSQNSPDFESHFQLTGKPEVAGENRP
jgi:hypothetical protein